MRDLYSDLRDRRLLPLVVLLIVAAVAAPFLLGHKDGEETPVAAQPIVVAPTSPSGAFSVVPAARKLRAYGDRLGYRNPRDPFSATSGEGSGSASGESAKSEGGGGESSSAASAEGGAQAGGGETTVESETVETTTTGPSVVKATIKAQVGTAAVIKAGYVGSPLKPLEIEDQTRLPEKNPAIVYTGTSKKGGALFLMTSQVTEFSGDGHCVLGGALCQVVELKVEDSESFLIGYGETRYKVHLLGFEPIIKEEVVEAEGRKIRVPSQENKNGKSKGEGQSQGTIGGEPSPRSLVGSVSAAILGAHRFSK